MKLLNKSSRKSGWGSRWKSRWKNQRNHTVFRLEQLLTTGGRLAIQECFSSMYE